MVVVNAGAIAATTLLGESSSGHESQQPPEGGTGQPALRVAAGRDVGHGSGPNVEMGPVHGRPFQLAHVDSSGVTYFAAVVASSRRKPGSGMRLSGGACPASCAS